MLKEFIDGNKKTPSSHSKNDTEKCLATWLYTQNKNYKNRTEGMINDNRHDVWTKFLEEYGEYFVSVGDKWDTNFDELKKFIIENKQKPSIISKNTDEKFLGRWVQTQCKNHNSKIHGMTNNKRYNVWTDFLEEYSEYFVSVDDKWDINFELLKEFINENKKMPSSRSKNEDEKFIGSWLNTQNNNHKNRTQGMKNDERYNAWSAFLSQYLTKNQTNFIDLV